MIKEIMSYMLIGTGSQICTLKELSIYLQLQAENFSNQVVKYFYTYNTSWRQRLVLNFTNRSEKQLLRQKLYKPILLELWLYSLVRIMPYIREVDFQQIKRLFSACIFVSLTDSKAPVNKQYFIERLDLMLQDRVKSELARDIATAIDHIIVQGYHTSNVRGIIRYSCIEFIDNWQHRVIIEVLVECIEESAIKNQTDKEKEES